MNPQIRKNAPAGAIVMVGVALGVWWALHTPYDAALLFRAVPAEALFVSVHDRISERAGLVAANPALRALLFHDHEETSCMTAPDALFPRKLDFDRGVAAYLPGGGASPPAWLAAVWLGSRSRALRWSFYWRKPAGVSYAHNHNGYEIWQVRHKSVPESMSLSVALADGMALACVSEDPVGVRMMLDAYDRRPAPGFPGARRESAQTSGARAQAEAMWPEPAAPDKGWLLSGARLAAFSIGRLDNMVIEARIRVAIDASGMARIPASNNFSAIEAIVHDLPALLAAAPAGLVLPALDAERGGRIGPAALQPLLRSGALRAGDEPLVLAVFTDRFAGGFGREPFRIRVPGLAVLAPIADTGGIEPAMGQALDLLNAHYRLGLILNPSPGQAGRYTLRGLENTVESSWFQLSADDLPAYSLADGFLLLASSARSLAAVLDRASAEPEQDRPARWRSAMPAGALACAWIDLDSGGKAIETAIDLLRMRLALGGAGPSRDSELLRNRMLWAKKVLQALRPLGEARVWAEPAGTNLDIAIRIGRLD